MKWYFEGTQCHITFLINQVGLERPIKSYVSRWKYICFPQTFIDKNAISQLNIWIHASKFNIWWKWNIWCKHFVDKHQSFFWICFLSPSLISLSVTLLIPGISFDQNKKAFALIKTKSSSIASSLKPLEHQSENLEKLLFCVERISFVVVVRWRLCLKGQKVVSRSHSLN